MEFPYIPLDLLMADVQSQFKSLNRTGQYNEDDAYTYAVEAAREIGLNNYDESTVGIPIRSHIGATPKDFYLVKEIWNVDLTDPSMNINNIRDAFVIGTNTPIRKNHLLHPGDSATVRYCCDKRTPFLNNDTPSFTLKIPPGRVRTSFKEGLIMLNYYHLLKDDRGVICVQDEINTIKSIKAYILMSLLKEDYIMQKIPRYVYQDIKTEYETYLDIAKAIHKFPDPSTDKYHANALRNRYAHFKL